MRETRKATNSYHAEKLSSAGRRTVHAQGLHEGEPGGIGHAAVTSIDAHHRGGAGSTNSVGRLAECHLRGGLHPRSLPAEQRSQRSNAGSVALAGGHCTKRRKATTESTRCVRTAALSGCTGRSAERSGSDEYCHEQLRHAARVPDGRRAQKHQQRRMCHDGLGSHGCCKRGTPSRTLAGPRLRAVLPAVLSGERQSKALQLSWRLKPPCACSTVIARATRTGGGVGCAGGAEAAAHRRRQTQRACATAEPRAAARGRSRHARMGAAAGFVTFPQSPQVRRVAAHGRGGWTGPRGDAPTERTRVDDAGRSPSRRGPNRRNAVPSTTTWNLMTGSSYIVQKCSNSARLRVLTRAGHDARRVAGKPSSVLRRWSTTTLTLSAYDTSSRPAEPQTR